MLILHTRTPPTPHRLINSNLIGRGLTSYTRAFGGLVLKCCVSAGGKDRRRPRRCKSEPTRSTSGLIAPDWQLGAAAQCWCGRLAKPARGSRIQFVWFLIAGNFEHERSRCTARPHNTIEALPDTNVYHLIKLKIVNMTENNCCFPQQTALCCHSSHVEASCWEISFDAIQSCGQITAVVE